MINLFSNCYTRFLYICHRMTINYKKKPNDKEHEQLVDDIYKIWQPNWVKYGE